MDEIKKYIILMTVNQCARDLEYNLASAGITTKVIVDVKHIDLEKFKNSMAQNEQQVQQSPQQKGEAYNIKILDEQEV